MQKEKERKFLTGFTLLELLIVIAIIGLLASVILVSYNGYIEKAKLANTLQWASGLSHSLFYEAVGVWSFNEGSGQTAQDESGKGNNGTLGSTGGSDVNDPVWRCANASSAYVPSGEGCSLEFDGTNDYVFVANNESFRIVSAITITAWVNPDTLSGLDIAVSRGLPYLSRNDDKAFFSINISGKTEGGTTQTNLSGNKNMQIGKWHHIVGIFDGFYMKVYLDGFLNTTKVVCGIASYPACPALMISSNGGYDIGRHRGNDAYAFDGYIDDVRIFKEAFTQTQVQQLYVQGLPTHQNLSKK